VSLHPRLKFPARSFRPAPVQARKCQMGISCRWKCGEAGFGFRASGYSSRHFHHSLSFRPQRERQGSGRACCSLERLRESWPFRQARPAPSPSHSGTASRVALQKSANSMPEAILVWDLAFPNHQNAPPEPSELLHGQFIPPHIPEKLWSPVSYS
jgi:hypothetical protein